MNYTGEDPVQFVLQHTSSECEAYDIAKSIEVSGYIVLWSDARSEDYGHHWGGGVVVSDGLFWALESSGCSCDMGAGYAESFGSLVDAARSLSSRPSDEELVELASDYDKEYTFVD